MENKKRQILDIIETDARLSAKQISAMLDLEEAQVKSLIKEMEEDGTIKGYKALIDWDKTEKGGVTAFIELKVSPQAEKGFDKLAEKICSYPEVRDMHLMSGTYDYLLLVEGKTLREVAFFVAEKLSTVEGILSTSTHFILRKYKDTGVIFGYEPEKDEREGIL